MILYLEKSEELIKSTQKEGDVFDKLINLFVNLLKFLNEFNEVFFISLRKHHPESYQVLINFREGFYYENFKALIHKGIEHKNIRQTLDIDTFICSHFMHFPLYLGDAEIGLNKVEISSRNFFNLLIDNIRGTTTLKGFKLLKSKNKIIVDILNENGFS